MWLQRFSSRDLTELFAYEEEYGPLDLLTRMDRLIAHLAAHFAAMFVDKDTEIDVRKFLPRWAAPPEQTLEQEIAAGRALAETLA